MFRLVRTLVIFRSPSNRITMKLFQRVEHHSYLLKRAAHGPPTIAAFLFVPA